MPNEALSGENIECIGCKEAIRSGASVCRYCGTPQKHTRWSKLSNMLKWLGGIVTVISLCIGMVTLSSYYLDWREKQEAVSELVNAADWLEKSEAYSQAWQVFEEALTLTPSSAEIRKGQYRLAKRWLRDFSIENDRADEVLSRITVVLYRSISEIDQYELATTLAHIGWIQVVRDRYSLATNADAGSLFERALRADPNNSYANAMAGHWLLRKRSVTEADVQSAGLKFIVALQGGLDREFIRRLQVSHLAYTSTRHGNEVRRAALSVLLSASLSMMENGEPLPLENIRRKILSGYGSINSGGENVEASLDMLPADKHLKVIDWLLTDLDYKLDTSRNGSQIKYLKARIVEAAGRTGEALELYQGLVSSKYTSEALDQLVNKSIERLTGELPARAIARNYRDDPIDAEDLWAFHRDTLSHFDPKWMPTNYQQALEYFEGVVEKTPANVAELVDMLPKVIGRIKSVLQDAEEIKRLDAYHMGFSVGHHENVRVNYVRLLVLNAQALSVIDKFDEAIAVLSDAKLVTDVIGDRQVGLQQMVLYELARAHAIRLSTTGDQADISSAVGYLKQFVELGGVNDEIATWDDIKGDDFVGLRENDEYKALVRGR